MADAPSPPSGMERPVRVAFMPDIHFHDVYANFQDGSFSGLSSKKTGKSATIRTMAAQLGSTRLFNENYFAFEAALDDAAKRGIRWIALPGDFSDDGQPVHVRGLVEILHHYEKTHDMVFFAAPGNHDPTRPFTTAAGKSDYLGEDGHPQRIYSRGAQECVDYSEPWMLVATDHTLPTICTEEVREQGYEEIMAQMGDFGFYPSPDYFYWETPYSDYDLDNSGSFAYEFEKALATSGFEHRQYEVCHQGSGGSYREPSFSQCAQVPDSSYLVEPLTGLWLLAIDANVYVPHAAGRFTGAQEGESFMGAGNAGYNKVMTHKRHLIDWIEQVVIRAEAQGKRLIAFSHYPMTEFYDRQSDAIADYFGADALQLARRPEGGVSEALAKTGLKVHVGGHMHINDTGVIRTDDGNVLFNIQAPSVAAYLPAYKILTLQPENSIDVETVVVDQVPRFDELFEHYRKEYQQLSNQGDENVWNEDILLSEDYREFTEAHIHALTIGRFMPSEWPDPIRQLLRSTTGRELLILSFVPEESVIQHFAVQQPSLEDLKRLDSWSTAERRASKWLKSNKGKRLNEFGGWTGLELAVDFYRLRNAGHLALGDIGSDRLEEYALLEARVRSQSDVPKVQGKRAESQAAPQLLAQHLYPILRIMSGLTQGEPSADFSLNTQTGSLQPLDHD